MGKQSRHLGRYDDALATFGRLEQRHPKSAATREALLIVGDFYFDRNELARAGKYYARLADGQARNQWRARAKEVRARLKPGKKP